MMHIDDPATPTATERAWRYLVGPAGTGSPVAYWS